MKRFLIAGFLLLSLSLTPTAQAGWVDAGSWGEDETIWLDDKIKPVADKDNNLIPYLYTLSYKTDMQTHGYTYTNYLFDLQTGQLLPLPGKTEMLTLSNRNIYPSEVESIWKQDLPGSNQWIFSAYLWKQGEKINKTKPYTMSPTLPEVSKNRAPMWSPDAKGWLQVYDKANGEKAWIHTTTIEIAYEPQSSLPSVQILVRREEKRLGEVYTSYSLEQYNPLIKVRTVMANWEIINNQLAPIPMKEPFLVSAAMPTDQTIIPTAAFAHEIQTGRKKLPIKSFSTISPTQYLF